MFKECIYHLRGICRNEDTCKDLHYDKKLTEIVFEDFNKKFLIGKIDKGELYIPLHLIERYYQLKKRAIPESFMQMNFEVTINPKKKFNHTNRYTVGTIISQIEHNEVAEINSFSHSNIDKRLTRLNEKIEKNTFEFNKTLAETKLEYNLKLDECKKNEIRLHTDIRLLNHRVHCLEQLLHKITSYTFLNDIQK